MKERRKVDFSNTPNVTSSLGDKLRGISVAASTPQREGAAQAPEDHTLRDHTLRDHNVDTNTASGPLSGCGKVVARMERKGHGGKVATVVDGLTPLDARLREALAKRLAKGLGAGARVDGLTIIVQGDQRTRIEALLREAGARNVVVA